MMGQQNLYVVMLSILKALLGISAAGILYIIGICVYRVHFHPLAAYPGPILAKITNLYSAYHAWKGDIHIDMWQCHEKYGHRVRYAPNRLLFSSAEAIKDIHGHRSNLRKSTVYNTLVHRSPNSLTIRDKAEHGRRRRIMSQGFSDAATRSFEPKILAQVAKLCRILATKDEFVSRNKQSGWKDGWGKPIDMSRYFEYLSFDIMSSLIFSANYNTLERSEYRHVSKAIEGSNIRMSVILQAPELKWQRLDKKLFPQSIRARNAFVKFVSGVLGGRMKQVKAQEKDIFSFFQNAVDAETGKGFGVDELAAETATLIVAGSDTTSTSMAATLFYISRDRNVYKTVTDEVRGRFGCSQEISIGSKLNSCLYLRACIDEALRMSPPAGSALWREVPKGGATIDGHFIPEDVDVGVGIYSIHHNSAYYPQPFKYDPERWLGVRETGSRIGDAYMPFSLGSRSCIGKGLALTELMLTMAMIIWQFEFKLAEKLEFADEKQFAVGDSEFTVEDHITSGAKKGPLLQFRIRRPICSKEIE